MSDSKLIETVKSDDFARVEALVETGADVNQQDEYGWTPLNWAAGKGNLEIARYLVDKGADVFKVGRDRRTPYMIALAAGRTEMVKFLRAAEEQTGLDIKRPERKYCKAYHIEDLRRFDGWTEQRINWKRNKGESQEDKESPLDVVFIHQDLTVTESMWHNENVIFNQISPAWEAFCVSELKFKVPDDLDLIVNLESANMTASA